MPQMSEEERLELCNKLDADLDSFIEEASRKRPHQKTVDNRTVDEMVQELKQHPAFMTEFDPSKPMSAEVEALMALKYNTDDAQDKAEAYKEDGNRNFKIKKYRWAIDNYTEGIKTKCADKELNAILYSNRAAAHSFIENYRSAINDCIFARKFKPDHLKAIIKGAQCHLKLGYCSETIQWCNSGLLIDPDNEKLLAWRAEAEQLKKVQERDARKQAAKERRENVQQQSLIDAVKARGVQLESPKAQPEEDYESSLAGELSLTCLDTNHPSGSQVKVLEGGVLVWPVLFLYPEHNESDFIEKFTDTDSISWHIEHMFGSGAEPPGWDLEERKYRPEVIDVYFEASGHNTLVKVDPSSCLADVLRDKRYVVKGGAPALILISRESKDFVRDFLQRYKLAK